jgi:predicted membrane GTPase involved in stress response
MSVKAEQRREQTKVTDFLEGMKKERVEAARARKEMAAAGLIDHNIDPDAGEKKEKKSLNEELSEDPFTELGLFLMDDGTLPAKKSGGKNDYPVS